MKFISRLNFLVTMALITLAFSVNGAQTERPITFALSGFKQGEDIFGNPKAIPFRLTTRDILEEIHLATGAPVTNGVLVMIESLDDTNAPTIVARKGTNQSDVTEFFTFNYGEFVSTELATRGTFYALDQIKFSSLMVDTNGYVIQFQGFTRESQAIVTRRLGTNSNTFVSKTLATDGNGELRFFGDEFFGPLKGSIRIGAPKVVATP